MAERESEYIIELNHIKKTFEDGNDVIKEFNLKIKKGEFVTFLGPSGCGKTTILRMIGGFEIPSEGEMLLDGKDISQLPPNQRPINTVFQKYALFPHLNIYDNIAFGLKLKKLSKDEIDKKVKHALEIVDLEGFEKRRVSTLSGGQQQRIAIARAIVNEPEILLLDEPLGALDFKMRKEMQLELKNMHEKLGITFIFVTHDQEEALTMSDKVVVMAHGEIQQTGTPEDIYNEPSNAFVADFIGESNIFKGIMTGKLKATFCENEFVCEDDYKVGTEIDAVVRPEDVILTKPEDGMITGEVIGSIFKGTFYEITILCGTKENEIVCQSTKNVAIGATVGIVIEPDGIHIMPYDMTKNHFTGILNQNLELELTDLTEKPDLRHIFPDAQIREDGVYTKSGEKMQVEGMHIDAFFRPEDGQLSDDPDKGRVQGNIASIIYKGNHYSYIVRSKNEVDYCVDDEYLWNVGDFVSIIIPSDKISYQIKEEE